jgi:surfactin synthase thioesterase subunit
MKPTIVFSHGKDGDPWGSKIVALAQVARELHFPLESVDYRDLGDPLARVARLLEFCRARSGPFILVGSSLGGHVAAAVSTQVVTHAMFLLAPAFYMRGYEQYTPTPAACPIEIVHGWRDEIVPIENSIRFGREHRVTLHIVDGDHRLSENIPQICHYFGIFLTNICSNGQLK